MKTISEIKEMPLVALPLFIDEVNSNTPESDSLLTLNAINALRTTLENRFPISNAMFYVMLHYITASVHTFHSTQKGSTFWLSHDTIKYWCTFSGFGGQLTTLYLTQAQGELLNAVLHLNYTNSADFASQLAVVVDGMLEPEEYTSEEMKNPLVMNYLLPQNSSSIEVAENTSRFSGATWFEAIKEKKLILAGLGGIGSYVCFLLSRMQLAGLYLYDDDIVEAANMSGQLYCNADIGKPKVDAMANMVAQYANFNNVFAIRAKYTSESDATDIMICGFDNMEARKTFYSKWHNHVTAKSSLEEKKKCLFIDGRLSAEYFQVFAITGDDFQAQTNYYTNELFSDEEADETVCSYKQTTYMANMIGSVMVNVFTNFVANEVAGAPIRELPYLTTYDGNSMKFDIE